MNKMIEEINVNDIFSEKYIIPIYQRKYAWTDKEIEQLLEDIVNISENKKYYLGTLIVNENNGKYEVIDGQQRLITLYLLMLCLGEKYQPQCQLGFEARKNYDKALYMLKQEKLCNIDELDNCCNVIKDFLNRKYENDKKNEVIIKDRLNDVIIVRVQVPEDTDLNHYFEIMNTRGEQLELHHIAKAKFLNAITDNNDKKTASIIWDACSQMNIHIQMNFIKSIREKLFTEYLSGFNGNFPTKDSIEDVWNKLQGIFEETADNEDRKELKHIIQEIKNDSYEQQTDENKDKNTNDERPELFESVIKFPYFLLYVNAVINKEENSKDGKDKYEFDDKNLLNILKNNWEDENKEPNAANAKYFIYAMLYCRILFDKYIIKKQNDDNNQINEKFILKYVNNKGEMRNTYGKPDNDYDYEDDEDSEEKHNNKIYTRQQLIALQSILRITYTSPRNMKWITALLKHLFYGNNAGLTSVTSVLENHCIEKIKEHYNISGTAEIEDFSEKKYNDIERIVFSYLDYILWRDGYKEHDKEIIKKHFEWKVKNRNSIEHFFAQSLVKDGDGWKEMVDCFGNLALVSVSDNSKLSNLNPKAKVAEYEIKDIINHNPKLKIMASYTKNGGEWTPEKAEEHQKEMFEILAKEINSKK